MKTQSWMFVAALAFVGGFVAAQEPKTSGDTSVTQRAEALTEEQINQSHDIGSLTKLAQLYASRNDDQRLAWVLHRVSELTPNSGDLKLQLALVYSKMGDKAHAYDTLMHMQVQGFGYDISKDPRFVPIQGTKVWDYLVANLDQNAKQFGEGKVAFELPKDDNLMTALAWDPKRKAFLIGSGRDGSIHLADEKGKLTNFIAAGANKDLWGVDALGVDSTHNKLYVTTSAAPRFSGFNADNADKAAVLEFELSTGKFLHKYTTQNEGGKNTFNAIAVSKDGQVYVADGAHKAVFKIDAGALKPIVHNPKLSNITALALTDDGRTLFLADYANGIYGFDLAKGAAFEPKYNSEQLVLGGIVGMHWYEGNLVIVEDGMMPKRVMRLKLSDDNTAILGAMGLDVANDAFATLGDGAIAGDNLYFVANRQDDLYDSHGVLTDASNVEPLAIFKTNVRFAWNQAGVMKSSGAIPVAKSSEFHKKPGVPDAADSDKH
jgi:DNA-binding beta-propeller fold protein YncE